MPTPHPIPSPSEDHSSSDSIHEKIVEAARFWEPRRIVYNLVLGAVVIFWVVKTWPHFQPAFTLTSLLQLSALAVLANVCYCAAYVVDIPAQYSELGPNWRHGRRVLWVPGMVLAFVFTNYWIADEIYPYVSN